MVIGAVEYKTNISFRKMDDFENIINAINIDYVREDVIFTGFVHNLYLPQFNVVNRSGYAKDKNYMKKIVENHGQNCFIPASGMCFIKCINYLTNKDYTKEFWDLNGNAKYRSSVATSAKVQPFCKIYHINNGCFDGKGVNPRKITEKITSVSFGNQMVLVLIKHWSGLN